MSKPISKMSIHDVLTAMNKGKTKADVLAIAKTQLRELENYYESRMVEVASSCASKIEEIDKQIQRGNQALEDTIKQCEENKQLAKRKMWCNNCLEEAKIVCCFGVAYCSKRCQELHKAHQPVCTRVMEDNKEE